MSARPCQHLLPAYLSVPHQAYQGAAWVEPVCPEASKLRYQNTLMALMEATLVMLRKAVGGGAVLEVPIQIQILVPQVQVSLFLCFR